MPNSLPGSVSFPKSELPDKLVDDGSFKPPPSSDDSGVRSNSPLGSELPLPTSDPKGSLLRVLSVDDPKSFELLSVSG